MADELLNIVTKINSAIRSDKGRRIALSTVMARHKTRIFEQGLDASGGKIGTYSTKPASIGRRQQARNTGQTYFKGGYSEYKSAVGKNPGYVILRNTDQMYADYGILVSGDSYAFGFQNTFNADKAGWMTDKYDKEIFHLSESELDTLMNVLISEL